MAILQIISKTYGHFSCLIDDEDFERVQSMNKWGVRYNKDRKRFYVEKKVNNKTLALHRFITNAPKGMYVDHINGDTFDNRSANLRICTNGANLRNAKLRKGNPSGVRGIGWDKVTNSWTAQIKVNYQRIWLGRHKTLESAVNARKQAEIKYWGV